MGWYRVVKTIKGHRYLYAQRTWREGKKVRTESRYIGLADVDGGRAPERGDRAENAAEPVNTTTALGTELVEETFAALLKPPVAMLPSIKPWDTKRTGDNLVERVEVVESVVEKLKVKLTHAKKQAFYDPDEDRVNIPPQQTFVQFIGETATQSYYATFLHELAHWTGHQSRIGRTSAIDLFFRLCYAREELVAEAAAMLLMKHFGIASRDILRHADYFQGWLTAAGDPAEALAYAKREAERAARFIIGVNTTDA